MTLTLCGCVTSTIQPESKNPEYGSLPTDYKGEIHKYWESTLKDPGSLQIKSIGTPEKTMVYSATEAPHGYDAYADVTFSPAYGYRICATINAKNSYGGYAGWKTEEFFFDNKGSFHLPIYMSEESLKGMHRTGTFHPETRITIRSCP
jgi:hypothetical protein